MKTYYLHYSISCGVSDEFETEDECMADAAEQNEEYPDEYAIYSYESENDKPTQDISIDDCSYIGYVGVPRI